MFFHSVGSYVKHLSHFPVGMFLKIALLKYKAGFVGQLLHRPRQLGKAFVSLINHRQFNVVIEVFHVVGIFVVEPSVAQDVVALVSDCQEQIAFHFCQLYLLPFLPNLCKHVAHNVAA